MGKIISWGLKIRQNGENVVIYSPSGENHQRKSTVTNFEKLGLIPTLGYDQCNSDNTMHDGHGSYLATNGDDMSLGLYL